MGSFGNTPHTSHLILIYLRFFLSLFFHIFVQTDTPIMRRAIIIGATSGIGRAVAAALLVQGWQVGIAGRREHLLKELESEAGGDRVVSERMDVTQDSATEALDRLIERLGDVDLLLFASGIGRQNRALDEHIELSTVKTNCEGMVRIVDHFINHVRHNPAYTARRKAHVAVITSVAGTMGIGTAPAYSATKKMQSTYLVALSQLIRMEQLPITLSDIRPGFVRTEILNPEKHYPMVISCERAAQYIIKGLARRKRIITFDWRYRSIVFFWRMIPRWLWERMTFVRN